MLGFARNGKGGRLAVLVRTRWDKEVAGLMARKVRWHLDTDVAVVGYGAAGAAAAIAARDGGARVLILEKQKAEHFVTSSFLSGGAWICPNDVDAATRYMEALSKVGDNLYWTEPEILRVWAQRTSENKKWIEELGGSVRLDRHGGEHQLPGVESIDVYSDVDMGPGLMRVLYHQVNARGIQVMYDTPAIELVSNAGGEVVGVQARSGNEGKVINVRARRAVILTTGGFEFNEEMKLQYLRAYPIYFLGSPANTGDGIRMALRVGAQLWHMNCISGRLVMKFPEFPFVLNPTFGGRDWVSPGGVAISGAEGPERRELVATAGYIVVDRAGKRFTKETFKPHTLNYELTLYDSQRLLYPRIPSYWIFDRRRMDNGPLVRLLSGPAGPAHLYGWSEDNRAELKKGWIKQGDTVGELAQKIGLAPQNLDETVNSYNLGCKRGEDLEFGRGRTTLVALDAPPYFAIELWPGGPNTQGGPRRNKRAQVLRADGVPVPRLYAAGELGSIYGMLYPSGGGNLAECIAFGRIAGENASGQKPLR